MGGNGLHYQSQKNGGCLPDRESGCPMADMITAEALIAAKKDLPGATVVCYVNSSAAVKAESDICCTSGNAVKSSRAWRKERLIFVPDQYLGQWVRRKNRPSYAPLARLLSYPHEDTARRYPDPEKETSGYIGPCSSECRPDAKAVADASSAPAG